MLHQKHFTDIYTWNTCCLLTSCLSKSCFHNSNVHVTFKFQVIVAMQEMWTTAMSFLGIIMRHH